MKKFLCGAFSIFLFVVNAFIVSFITYYIAVFTIHIEDAMIFLYFHGLFGVIVSVLFLIGVFRPTPTGFVWTQRFLKWSYYPYIASHLIGIVYYSFIIGSLKTENEQFPYRIYIFFFMINLAVFWWIYHPAIDVAKEGLIEREKLARKEKVRKE